MHHFHASHGYTYTFHGLRHLRLYEPQDGPVGVPVVHLPEPAPRHDERALHQDQARLVLHHVRPDLATELFPAGVDLGPEPPIVWCKQIWIL